MAKKKTSSAKKVAAKKAPAKKVAAKKTVAKKISVKKVEKTKTVTKKNKPTKKVAPKVITDATKKIADAAVEGILEVKGKEITVMNLKNIHNRVCDYYIICQADSTTQVNAIAGSVEEMVKKLTGEKPYRSEGFQNSEWILIDYVTVVVHVFQSHIREFYNIEALWADAETTTIKS